MYCTVEDFIAEWKNEAALTQKILDGLTDESLSQQVYPEGRTLGRIAWHFVTNIPDYLTEFGLTVAKVPNSDEVPSAKVITDTFRTVSIEVEKALHEQWTDGTLKQVQKAFGRVESNATIFMGLIKHIVHHRGQVTVLMRQAGLPIPAVYGPSKEGWARLGIMPPL
ncbi:DinB family protein [Paenibacillus dokdonensis]|uniref:DinB family protein n=1 Tax=Paenibacillus dokdonensis TaxID=2567944 RepID=UPI0010A7E45E|nr:DinB family protein [Paenibacillus dokdonensis]